MKRLVLGLIPLVLVVSACATGEPKPPTQPSATGITLNANVYSSINGRTDYWFAYGEPRDPAGWTDTPHGTVDVAGRGPYPVSEVVTGLDPDTVYGWQVCVADRGETPNRVVCSKQGRFGTVGDYVRGQGLVSNPNPLGTISFNDVRSGPTGENPAGTVSGNGPAGSFSYPVSCLLVDGTHATIGIPNGYMYVDVPTDPLAAITYDEQYAPGHPPDCSAFPFQSGSSHLTGVFSVHDAR
jgi:hypothetical protein